MRHQLFSLDARTAAHATEVRSALQTAQETGEAVTFEVAKRDAPSQRSVRTGTVVSFSGAAGMSSDAVTVETPDGFRTFNVWLIGTVRKAD